MRRAIDLSCLPALAAAFMLVFARIGTMVMLLPGLGEQNIPARMRLTFALLLAADHPAAASQRLSHRPGVAGAGSGDAGRRRF